MAVTVNAYDSVAVALHFGVFQKTPTLDTATRTPFFVTLRSVGVETFDATDDGVPPTVRPPGRGELELRDRLSVPGVPVSTAGQDELATGNGYTVGGKALENVRVVYSSGVMTMYADDLSWAATGAGFTAKSALLCYEYPSIRRGTDVYTNCAALALIDFDASVAVVAGTSLTLQCPSSGILKWSLA
jgi:hypothetical protein